MTKIPSNKIEEKAVRVVSEAIDSCPLLKADVKLGDKGISWDGDILYYNNHGQKKSQLEGILPVQVKGKTVNKFKSKNCSYSCEISDLKNYLLKKGVIFFVVEIDTSMGEHRIYYAVLLPVDLRRLLENAKTSQKTATIHLKYIPNNRYSSLQYICKDALSNMKLQWSNNFIDLEDIDKMYELVINVIPEGGDIEKHILENEIYIYGRRNKNEQLIPFNNKINIDELIRDSISKSVSINGKNYYSRYKVINDINNGLSIRFGKGIKLFLNKSNIKFKAHGSLEERIRDSDFMINFFHANSFYVNGNKFAINFDRTKENIKLVENIKKYLEFLRNVENMFNFFGIIFEDDLDLLIHNSKHNLEWLINNANEDFRDIDQISKTGFYNISIGSLCIGIYADVRDDRLKTYNLFGDFYKLTQVRATNATDGIEAIVSPYILLKAEEILMFSNFKTEPIKHSIKMMELSELSSNLLINFLLEVIKSYDKEPYRKELLLLAESIQDHLDSYSIHSITNIVNRFQIYKRQRQLSKIEKSELMELRNSTKDNQMLCAINILLDNISEYELYFDELTYEEQEKFNNYPISRFRYKIV